MVVAVVVVVAVRRKAHVVRLELAIPVSEVHYLTPLSCGHYISYISIYSVNDITQYHLPPLSGHDLENISITGEGIFDGGGDSWRPIKKEKTTAAQWKNLLASGGVLNKEENIWWPSRAAMEGTEKRPVLLQLNHCKRILLEGITLRNSPKFVFYPNNCTDLTMDHVSIFNEWWAQNGDGIDISACKNVVIYKCTVNAGDDGICMKSSGGKGGEEAALEMY